VIRETIRDMNVVGIGRGVRDGGTLAGKRICKLNGTVHNGHAGSKHMKRILALVAGVLSMALCEATGQDLNKLELGIHELAEVKTLTGVTLVFDPTKIIMVYAPPRTLGTKSGSGRTITNIVGLAGGPQEVDEPANDLLERLNLKPYFLALTLPDGVPVWVKVSAVSFLRATEPWDHSRPEAKSAMSVGGRPIFLKENVATIKDAINAVRRQNRP
jgi:hypothetical protein